MKIFTEDEFEKINYVGRHSAARSAGAFRPDQQRYLAEILEQYP